MLPSSRFSKLVKHCQEDDSFNDYVQALNDNYRALEQTLPYFEPSKDLVIRGPCVQEQQVYLITDKLNALTSDQALLEFISFFQQQFQFYLQKRLFFLIIPDINSVGLQTLSYMGSNLKFKYFLQLTGVWALSQSLLISGLAFFKKFSRNLLIKSFAQKTVGDLPPEIQQFVKKVGSTQIISHLKLTFPKNQKEYVQGEAGLPAIYLRMADFFLSEQNCQVAGIFRSSGDPDIYRAMKKQILAGNLDIIAKENRPLQTAALLKSSLIALRPAILHECYLQIMRLKEWFQTSQLQYEFMQTHVNGLPESRKKLLKVLVFLIERIARHSEHSKMTVSNLAICLAPCFIHAEGVEESVEARRMACKAFQTVINHRMELFGEKWAQKLDQ